ncbi:hypothetical protein Tco_0313043 [Tanacetum coccineum]
MKIMIEKHKTDRVFATYDLVLLKLQTYLQSTLWQHKHHKLYPKYYGPYKVVARIGQVAYKLELLVNSQIHLVFHESQFKFKGDAPHMPARLPLCDAKGGHNYGTIGRSFDRITLRKDASKVYGPNAVGSMKTR